MSNSQSQNLPTHTLQIISHKRKSAGARIEKLKAKMMQMHNALNQAQNQAREVERKADVSRKIIVGGWALAEAQKNVNFAKYIQNFFLNDPAITDRQRLILQPVLRALEVIIAASSPQNPPQQESQNADA